MTILTALRSELFRPFITQVVPGSLASAPFILVANYHFPIIHEFWARNPTAFSIMILITVLAVGAILENLGSRLEFLWWEIQSTKDSAANNEWNEYLRLKLKDEIIGQRYLRSVLPRLKFELSMAPSLLISFAGLIWLNKLYDLLSFSSLTQLSVFFLILIALFLFESYQSVKLLTDVRRQILISAKEQHC